MKLHFAIISLLIGFSTAAGAASITVDASKPGIPVAPTMYGLFFEEINHSGDSGLYAEMVRNRGFEDYRPSEKSVLKENGWWISAGGRGMRPDNSNNGLVAWSLVNDALSGAMITLDKEIGLNPKTSSSLRLEIADNKPAGIANAGYWGMSAKQGENYNLSFYVKSKGTYPGKLTAFMQDTKGMPITNKVTVSGVTGKWKQFKAAFKATGTDPKSRLVILASSNGTLWFDFVSLFPETTWKNQPKRFRADLMQMLADINPGFMRWPGGCIVEGISLANGFNWKDTIGPIEERPGKWNLWGYRRTDGFGYLEFLELCEDLKCEPLLVVNCGISCQWRSPEFCALDKQQPFIQDALDAIEYANGPVTSKWGKVRAEAGHPKPFNLKYLEIGNENWGQEYADRYIPFYNAIKAKYPNIICISDNILPGMKMEINDEHYYNKPEFFEENANKYDTYDRKGPKVFIGEVACTEGCGKTGNLRAALGEAAFLIGAERNPDIVKMISYAPLLVNDNNRVWSPDTIIFDTDRAYGNPSYYLYKLFGNNRPDVSLPTVAQFTPSPQSYPGRIGFGTFADTKSEYKDIKVEKDGQILFQSDFSKGLDGWEVSGGKWEVADGCLRQEKEGKAFIGDMKWSDYTLTCKARKISGNEGFAVYFTTQPSGDVLWNIGGWGNSSHALMGGFPENGKPGKVETNKWYDIKIVCKGESVKAYLDGELIHEVTRPTVGVYATAGREDKTGDIIIKISNPVSDSFTTDIAINGAANIKPSGTETVMTSADPWDENSFESPTKVAPVTKPVTGLGSTFKYTVKPYSLTVLRLKTK